MTLPLVALHPVARSVTSDGERGNEEIEEKVPKQEDLSLLLGAARGEGGSPRCLLICCISSSCPGRWGLTFSFLPEKQMRDIQGHPRRALSQLGSTPNSSLSALRDALVSAAGKEEAGHAEAGDAEIPSCSSCNNYLGCPKNSRS